MVTETLAEEVLQDLLRSAWIVSSARGSMYESWSSVDSRYEESARRARRQAEIVATSLDATGRSPDHDLVEPHVAWMRNLLGEGPDDTPLGPLFVVRLGDWVQAHTADFLAEGVDEFKRLGDEERAGVVFPSSLPDPPPFEPLRTPEVDLPGEVVFRFGILGDLHIGSQRAEQAVRAAISDLNESGAELVIQLGDITDAGNRQEFQLAAQILEGLEMPFVTMLGNHDVFARSEGRLSGHEYYSPLFGREADGVLLEHKGFRFAVLDSADVGASPFAPFDLVAGTFTEGPGGAVVGGALTPPQHDILADVAAPGGAPTFVFLHHPPQPFTSFPPVLFGLRDSDTGRLHATCESGNVWGVFAGHTHRNARPRTFGHVPVQEVGIPRDFPFGFAVVDVAKEGYAYRFLQLSDQDLVERMTPSATAIHRRYGRGRDDELAFSWTRPQAPS
ncbi:MAG: metallophosphoesterase [Actinomycetota bacterium]|nr:metallophosphoesterase [Actinomycetota bacterium]